jgi:hypothetical protein
MFSILFRRPTLEIPRPLLPVKALFSYCIASREGMIKRGPLIIDPSTDRSDDPDYRDQYNGK